MDKLKIVLKRVLNWKVILFVIVLLSANTYAWFLYATRVDMSIIGKVRAWNILVEVNEEEITQELAFFVNDLYPDMEEYNETLTITNSGDTNANLSLEIKSARILDKTYNCDDESFIVEGVEYEDLEDLLANAFPFKIGVITNQNYVLPHHEELVHISTTWPDIGEDVIDTRWGEAAYTYNSTHPGKASIELSVLLEITQNNDELNVE